MFYYKLLDILAYEHADDEILQSHLCNQLHTYLYILNKIQHICVLQCELLHANHILRKHPEIQYKGLFVIFAL